MAPETAPRIQRDDLRETAFSAHGRDWGEAVRAWEAYRILFPDDPDGFIFGTLALRENGKLAEAQALSDSVLDLFAHHPRLFVERAFICFFTRDWPEAKRRFAQIRKSFPGEPEAYLRGAEIAQNLGQHDEALGLMEAAVRQFPDSRDFLEDYARLAERLADPRRAAAAWSEHRARYAEEAAFIGEARALANAGDPGAGEALLVEGLALHPGARALMAETARMAVRRADWPETVRRWTALADDPDFGTEAASRLKDAERFMAGSASNTGAIGQRLEALLSRWWTLRFRSGQILAQNIALGPHGELRNHYGGERRWAVRNDCICFLDERDFITTRFTTADVGDDGRLRLTGRDWIHPTADSYFVLEEQRPSIGTVLTAFESLGDNCEFGLVQRFYRAEPLGLLRFNWSGYVHLLSALSSNFAVIDDPDCVRISRSADGELIGHVDAYQFYYHTHRYNTDVDLAAFAKTEAVRLRYLADMLIENIEDGRRIFVRKGEGAGERDKILRLHDCMKRLGDCTLLWVTEADDAHPSGTVELIGAGLLRGYTERFSPSDAAGRALFDTWAEICDRAHQLVYPGAWGHQNPLP